MAEEAKERKENVNKNSTGKIEEHLVKECRKLEKRQEKQKQIHINTKKLVFFTIKVINLQLENGK